MNSLLIGCHAKIERARESIENLDREIKIHAAADPSPYRLVREFRNDGRQYAFVAFGKPVVPPRFSVLSGEIVHHLRSSLDHLVCALVSKNGGTPNRQHQFPIYTSTDKFDEACKRGMIKGVSGSAEKLIRSVQPFADDDPEDHVLLVIQQFDNLDKHQLLLVVCTVMAISDQIRVNPKREGIAIAGMTPPNPVQISEDGALVFGIDFAEPLSNKDFDAEADFVSQVAFEKCGRAEFAPVIQTLTILIKGAANTIDRFKSEF